MTPVPFFFVPLALGSGFVLGWLLSWVRGSETRRRLREVRLVVLQYSLITYRISADAITLFHYVNDALSGKERK